MNYSWQITNDDIYLWILSNGSLSMGTFADLRYTTVETTTQEVGHHLYYVYAALSPAQDGVNTVAADFNVNNAPVEYFSINGMRVNGNNLVPGLYIKRQGTEVTKVIVK
jgi:hypothetical protein